MDQLTGSQNTMFEVASYDVVTIGSQVIYKGSPWFVESTERIMENGLLKSVYRLRQREGLKVLPYFNQNITGVSIDGTISGVQRDRVQVEMEIEAGDGGSERYWFPFSTVAASSDGSGWYCMPEAGESVRVYFPTDDEKEA
ncbi:phage baseplate assembly protein V [Enterocloster sp.]